MMFIGLVMSSNCVLTCQRKSFQTSHRPTTLIIVSMVNAPLKMSRKSSFIRPLLPSRTMLSMIANPWSGSQYLTPSHIFKRVLSLVVIPSDSSNFLGPLNALGRQLSMTADHWKQSSFRQPSHTLNIKPSLRWLQIIDILLCAASKFFSGFHYGSRSLQWM